MAGGLVAAVSRGARGYRGGRDREGYLLEHSHTQHNIEYTCWEQFSSSEWCRPNKPPATSQSSYGHMTRSTQRQQIFHTGIPTTGMEQNPTDVKMKCSKMKEFRTGPVVWH